MSPNCLARGGPKVSYVVAAYNHERYIGKLLRSILDQTYADFELIVVDDGSCDATAEIADRMVKQDSRARLLRQENQGVTHARNRGVAASCGEYVSIVDSDDLLPPERTAWQIAALEENPEAALVYGDAGIIDARDRRAGRFFDVFPPVPGDFSVELFANYCFVPAISVMFRRSAFDRSGPFWGPGPNTDYLKWIELGLLGPVICLADRELGFWRQHAANTSRPAAVDVCERYVSLRRGLGALAQRHPDLAARIGPDRLAQRYARCHFMGGFYAGLASAWPAARDQYREAYRLDRSMGSRAAWASTLPGINRLSHTLYEWVAGRRLQWYVRRPSEA